MADPAPSVNPPQAPAQSGHAAGLPDDTFTVYVAQRLLPFIRKYLWLLIVVLLAVAGGIAGAAAWASHARAVERGILNDIYTTLSRTKEVNLAVLGDLNARYPGTPAALEVRWRLAGEYVRTGAYDKAVPVYREIIAANGGQPITVHAVLALGSCLEQANDLDGAVKAYKEAAAVYATYPRIRAYLGYRIALVRFQKGDLDGTQHDTSQALAVLESAPAESRLRMFDADLAGRLEYLRNLGAAKMKKNG
jgi:tetratricopeptide (TPR) repeat protein